MLVEILIHLQNKINRKAHSYTYESHGCSLNFEIIINFIISIHHLELHNIIDICKIKLLREK